VLIFRAHDSMLIERECAARECVCA
jgi:hypothetical protein